MDDLIGTPGYDQPFYISEAMAKRMGRHKEWLHGWRYLPASYPQSKQPEEPSPAPTVKGLYWQQQVESERIHVRNQVSSLFKEVESLKAKVKSGRKPSKYD